MPCIYSFATADNCFLTYAWLTKECDIQVLVKEQPRQWYHFLTTLCAIIGGVFTVCGILDGISFSAVKMMKKVELGKQG